MQRSWFWGIEAVGQGPDYVFQASFAPKDAALLAETVRQYPLDGFGQYQVDQGRCAIHNHVATFDLYIDDHNYSRMVAMLEGSRSDNIWIFHTIEVCGHDLLLTRGYSGYPNSHDETETGLLAMLADHPHLVMRKWHIGYGGDGYASGAVAAGTAAAELRTYLASAK